MTRQYTVAVVFDVRAEGETDARLQVTRLLDFLDDALSADAADLEDLTGYEVPKDAATAVIGRRVSVLRV